MVSWTTSLLIGLALVYSAYSSDDDEFIPDPVDEGFRNPMENPNLFGGDMVDVNFDNDRNAIASDSLRWPNGIVPFYIDPSLSYLRSRIVSAMAHYHQYTCIRFKERTTERNYVHIFRGSGCYSNVGMMGNKQTLSLGSGCESHGIIVHELGHAVGFYHEQNRSDRDGYLNILYNNIERGMASQFVKLNPYQNRLLDRFDYNSIMLYGEMAFSSNNRSPTMTAKQAGVRLREVHQKPGLSASDVLRIKKLYRC